MGRWGRRWTHLPGEPPGASGPAGSRRVGGRYVAGAARVYRRGRTRFRSRWEYNYSHFLDFLGIAWRYEPQRYYFPGVRRGPAASYLPDFVLATGEIHEVKGYLDRTSAARLRHRGGATPSSAAPLTTASGGSCRSTTCSSAVDEVAARPCPAWAEALSQRRVWTAVASERLSNCTWRGAVPYTCTATPGPGGGLTRGARPACARKRGGARPGHPTRRPNGHGVRRRRQGDALPHQGVHCLLYDLTLHRRSSSSHVGADAAPSPSSRGPQRGRRTR